ncbi:MAG: (2Fe-2S)-binding protein [Phycisphaerales bacterium]
MEPDDHVCLCFRVPLRKIRAYLRREDPPVASLISECLGAGTGCQWCVPFLKELHRQHAQGNESPDLRISPERYASQRTRYRQTGQREDEPPDAGEHPPGDAPATGDQP